MAYRQDDDALRVRIAELEGDLAEARRTIARLRGDVDATPLPSDAPDWFTGVPMYLHREVELPFDVTDDGLVAISDFLCAKIPGGNASQIGDTLTHRKGSYEMRFVRSRDGRCSIRLKGDYRPARFQLGLGTPGLALLGAVFMLPAAVGLKLGAIGIVCAGLIGAFSGFFFLRELLRRAMARDRQLLLASFEGVAQIAQIHRRARARIAEEAEQATAAADATGEAEAVEDADVHAQKRKLSASR